MKKFEGKKIGKMERKMEEHKKGRKIKINLKSINYFYMLF